MRVLLVNPPGFAFKPRFKTYATFPYGLLYMAAVLEEHGHEVRVYDNVIDFSEPKDFIPFKPDIIGFSVVTGPNIDAAIAQSEKFKEIIPGVKTVWGGSHSSILPQQTLAEPYIDYVVIGAGEYTLLELIEHLEKGDKLGDINGLAYKEDGRIVINEPRPFIKDLDALPDPAWHLVDVSKYWDITLSTSRGCPFNCTFCYNVAFHKNYRAELSAERIVAQIEHLQKRYGTKYIKIWEDNFTFNRARLRRFCQLITEKRLKVKWDTESRATLAEEDIALMARSGCVSLGLGMESGSQRILDFIKKGTNVTEMEKTFWLLVKHKIIPRLYIIVGLPTETTEDFNLTNNLLERLDHPPYSYMRYTPYPGTALLDYCITNRLISPPEKLADWGNFTTMAATQINMSHIPQEMIEEGAAHFKKTYAVRPLRFALRHNPAYFWSLIRSPSEFWRILRNLTKYYLMILFGASDSFKGPRGKASPQTNRVSSSGRGAE